MYEYNTQLLLCHLFPEFKRGILNTDMALLKLNQSVSLRRNLQPACLPTVADFESWVPGTECFVVGFGFTQRTSMQGVSKRNFTRGDFGQLFAGDVAPKSQGTSAIKLS